MTYPKSPREAIDGIIYLPRLCDKIRLFAKNELHEDYHPNLGGGMDLWLCQFFGIHYADIETKVKNGASDEDIAAWLRETGCSRPDYEYDWWCSYMVNRGFRDDLAERLAERKAAAGWQDRDELCSFMDLIDADEGRL